MKNESHFRWQTEQFDDIKILRYQVPAFEQLTARERIFVYYLSRAALAGRDILWDQNCRYNLALRRVLEQVIRQYSGNREDVDFQNFMLYAKKVFFANGIHHHYSMDKFVPHFSREYWRKLLADAGCEDAGGELEWVVFEPAYLAKRVLLEEGKDLIAGSANNYYQGVIQQEAEDFYKKQTDETETCPVSKGLNSTLVKDKDGIIREQVWKVGGKYGKELQQVVYWLEQALPYACNEQQQKAMRL